VQPYRAATGCEAMRPRGGVMQMGLSPGFKDTIRLATPVASRQVAKGAITRSSVLTDAEQALSLAIPRATVYIEEVRSA
jgi:hypothetical protein